MLVNYLAQQTTRKLTQSYLAKLNMLPKILNNPDFSTLFDQPYEKGQQTIRNMACYTWQCYELKAKKF